MSNHSHRLLREILGAGPEDQWENLGEVWGGGGMLELGKRKHE